MSVLNHITLPAWLKPAFVQRMLLFIVLFVLISGLSGSWLISKKTLLFPFYFSVYGSAGKSLLFGLVAFVLLTRGELFKTLVPKFNRLNILFCMSAFICLGLFFWLANQLLYFQNAGQVIGLTMATHAALMLSGCLTLIGVFGIDYIKGTIKLFKREFLISLVLSTIFYFLFSWIFKLWPYLSSTVLWAVLSLLKITNPEVVLVPPLTIQLPQFAITVGQYCSGIESLFLITVLYILIGCLDWQKLRKINFIALYVPLIIGMFCLNIVRVYTIIQAGVLLSPEIAGKLFHTYLGMILFMIYFFYFLKLFIPIDTNYKYKTEKGHG